MRIRDERRTILICHDESTFRMSETPSHRWVWNKEYGFFNKGSFITLFKYFLINCFVGLRRSLMVSDYLVLDNEPFFQLNENEFKQALRKYPELNSTDNFYLKNSATVHLEPG